MAWAAMEPDLRQDLVSDGGRAARDTKIAPGIPAGSIAFMRCLDLFDNSMLRAFQGHV
jgi:hypothetical protein